MTVIDLQYYNEISTIVQLTQTELTESKFPNISVWYNERMRGVPEIQELDRKLLSVITQYEL